MKVLLNASTLRKGGGLQVASALIVEAIRSGTCSEWVFLISPELAEELAALDVPMDSVPFEVVASPARNTRSRRRIRRIEEASKPDVVFTLFGPAYVRFRSPHLCGVADPWVTHGDRLAARSLGSPFAILSTALTVLYKGLWWKTADFWWVEAAIARDGLVSRWRCDPASVFVVPNSYGPPFVGEARTTVKPIGRECRILCLSADYPHKNLEIIPEVAFELRKSHPDLDFKFTVTLTDDSRTLRSLIEGAERLGVGKHIENVGQVAIADVPALYLDSDVCFLPSVLEVFSAVYAEALYMGVPLVTTDRKFAKDACGTGAAYFRPYDAQQAAEQIGLLARDYVARSQLVERGRLVANALPDPAEKHRLLMGLLAQVPEEAKDTP